MLVIKTTGRRRWEDHKFEPNLYKLAMTLAGLPNAKLKKTYTHNLKEEKLSLAHNFQMIQPRVIWFQGKDNMIEEHGKGRVLTQEPSGNTEWREEPGEIIHPSRSHSSN